MSGLYQVTIGRFKIACFASDRKEAIERACLFINGYYNTDLDADTVVCDVSRIRSADVDFNDEVI